MPPRVDYAAVRAGLPMLKLKMKHLSGVQALETEEVRHQFDWYNEERCLDPDCRFHARPSQTPPEGDWLTWLALAGRGWGKTRTGAGFVHQRAMAQPRWIAMVAKTPADARDYMIEGKMGILRNTHPSERPIWQSSKRRLTWPNGSWATVYSSEDPDQLRGFSGDTFWLDEFAKWAKPKLCWDNLMFGMREKSDDRPRGFIGTTPRPLEILKKMRDAKTTVKVTGTSYDNEANLAKEWYEEILSEYEGTRFGRQEIYAEILEDVEGALWQASEIEEMRLQRSEVPKLSKIVTGVDPSGTVGGDEQGIITMGIGACSCKGTSEIHGFVLRDDSGHFTPDGWGRAAIGAMDAEEGDLIIAESNFGGDMVESTIRHIDPTTPYVAVHASRGKRVRAEPIAALSEQRKIHMVGVFDALENQLTQWTPDQKSPDRLDGFVWAATYLFPKGRRSIRAW